MTGASGQFRIAGFAWLPRTEERSVIHKDFALEASLGNVAGYSTVNKYGEALDCDSGVDTDIWDGADGTTSTDVWVPPTTARTHDLTSTSTADDTGGTGMVTCQVYGLTDWDTAEVSETVTLDGTANVATANSYVIIHRIKGLTFGTGGTNAGIITATAQTDATVTAAIQAGEGQTQMLIYGIPSTKVLRLEWVRGEVVGTVNANVQAKLLVKENADLSTAGWITKEKFYFSLGSGLLREYDPPKKITGPAIVKMQVSSSAANASVTASFDAHLVDA